MYNFSEVELLAMALVLFRMIAFIIAMPVIGVAPIPIQIKVLFALSMTFIIFPVTDWKGLSVEISNADAAFLAAKEIAIGLIFGFLGRMFFMTLSMAGQLISISMGISNAQLFNPAFGESSTAFDQFFIILATLFFFSIQGHHLMISGLVETFNIIPIYQSSIDLSGFAALVPMSEKIIEISLKFASPILVTILFTNVAMGVVGRAVPQINILITSLPVNTLVGLFVLFVGVPVIVWQMQELMEVTLGSMFLFMKGL